VIVRLDRLGALLVAFFGLLHLYIGRAVFADPTTPRIWFAAGGFLLVTTGLANFAAASASRPSRLDSAAALSGSLALLILGGLIARGDPGLLGEPQTVVLLAIGLFLAARRAREMVRRQEVASISRPTPP
jgi:peptidoglycan/LPS O-acetylase OafA/YrhL